MLLVSLEHKTAPSIYLTRLTKSMFSSLKYITSKAKKATHYFVFNDKGNMLTWHKTIAKEEHVACSKCKREPYLSAQTCVPCRNATAYLCMTHVEPASRVCNVPPHTGSISRRYRSQCMSSMLFSLMDLTESRMKSNLKGQLNLSGTEK